MFGEIVLIYFTLGKLKTCKICVFCFLCFFKIPIVYPYFCFLSKQDNYFYGPSKF